MTMSESTNTDRYARLRYEACETLLNRIKDFIETPEMVLDRAFLFAGAHNGQPQQAALETLWRDLQKDLTLLAGVLVGAVVIEPDSESDVMSFRPSPLQQGLAIDEHELRQWLWGSAHVPWLGVAPQVLWGSVRVCHTDALLDEQAASLQTLKPALTAEESQNAMKVDWRLVHVEVEDAVGLPDEATKLKWLYWFKNGDARQPDSLVVHHRGRWLTPQNIVWDGLPVPVPDHVLGELDLVANELERSGNGDITPAAVAPAPAIQQAEPLVPRSLVQVWRRVAEPGWAAVREFDSVWAFAMSRLELQIGNVLAEYEFVDSRTGRKLTRDDIDWRRDAPPA